MKKQYDSYFITFLVYIFNISPYRCLFCLNTNLFAAGLNQNSGTRESKTALNDLS